MVGRFRFSAFAKKQRWKKRFYKRFRTGEKMCLSFNHIKEGRK